MRIVENADVVAAINILRARHAWLTCEVSGAVRPPAAGTHKGDQSTAALTQQKYHLFWWERMSRLFNTTKNKCSRSAFDHFFPAIIPGWLFPLPVIAISATGAK